MGADLYLESVVTDAVVEQAAEDARRYHPGFKFTATAYYDNLRATGGYFRDGYNALNFLRTIGLDWGDDVGPRRVNGRLPLEGVQWLRDQVANKEMVIPTPADLRAWASEGSPFVPGSTMQFHHSNVHSGMQDLGASDLREIFEEKRACLLALCDRALALREPLTGSF